MASFALAGAAFLAAGTFFALAGTFAGTLAGALVGALVAAAAGAAVAFFVGAAAGAAALVVFAMGALVAAFLDGTFPPPVLVTLSPVAATLEALAGLAAAESDAFATFFGGMVIEMLDAIGRDSFLL